ncbi:uncharacterized protein LOC113207119 isoform X2 [Frankliniella occidentalis]|uniref:Uncharacterized protein LOC113207119 isoform X2 n=1 Tax=Frankliniella occidentalis TaxID=133901 RepID=A0A9C6X689_FRAOC|nr:uncharacterized protein LOC113207119 isoform X2 [Frankliniella occidentalis]
MLMYAVVELHVDRKPVISPALISWLTGVTPRLSKGKEEFQARTCLWPAREKYLNEYLIHKRTPKKEWVTFHNVRVFKFCKSLATAKGLAEKLVDTSDVGDLNEDSDDNLPPKRKRNSVKVFGESSVDEDDGRPVKGLKISKCDRPTGPPPTSPQHSSSDDESGASSDDSFLRGIRENRDAIDASQPNSTSLLSEQNVHAPTGKRTTTPQLNNQPPSPKLPSIGSNLGTSSVTPSSQPISSAGINTRILTHLSLLKSEIQELKKMVLKVYIVTCGPHDGSSDVEKIPGLPLQTETDFENFTSLCEKEDGKLGMVKHLSEHGKTDIRESVFNMMRKLMTNTLAQNYNYSGINRRGASVAKKKFAETTPCTVLRAAVKQHCRVLLGRGADSRHQFNSTDFKDAVSDWLKDAKKRNENEEKKKKKNETQQENVDSDLGEGDDQH